MGAFLENQFNLPVFINNDGDLYAYGEALGGILPEINRKLTHAGSAKQYKNLIGYTFGTGFGIGIVTKNELHIGDNSCVETFCLPHKNLRNIIVEDGVSVRAVKRVYSELSGDADSTFEPKDIFDIAGGNGRELHTELSKDAINYECLPDYMTHYSKAKNSEIELASCDYFTSMLYDLDSEFTCDYSALDFFVVVICLEGEGLLVSDDGDNTTLHRGETILLPATTKNMIVKPNSTMKILTSYVVK